MGKINKPMGAVNFLGNKEPVIWERETDKYVFNVIRLVWNNGEWIKKNRNFEDKMDKEEIFNFNI
jgi:hypothetical protein